MKSPNLNRYLDHTLLVQDATTEMIEVCCREAIEYSFKTVMVNPGYLSLVCERLKDHDDISPATVIGFPLGANTSEVKKYEAMQAAKQGAAEIDMVTRIDWLCENRFSEVEKEISLVRKSLPEEIILKVIIETARLSPEQQKKATKAIINGGAQYVKTSTGFFGGVTVEPVQNLVQEAQGKIKVKASGGIKTLAQAEILIQAGADRLGCSASVAIIMKWNDDI